MGEGGGDPAMGRRPAVEGSELLECSIAGRRTVTVEYLHRTWGGNIQWEDNVTKGQGRRKEFSRPLLKKKIKKKKKKRKQRKKNTEQKKILGGILRDPALRKKFCRGFIDQESHSSTPGPHGRKRKNEGCGIKTKTLGVSARNRFVCI